MTQATAHASKASTGSSAVTREVLPYSNDSWSGLRNDWLRLCNTGDLGSAFLSAAWIDTWWQSFAGRYRPTGLRWRSGDGEVVGCALLPGETIRLGPVPVRRMSVNASGISAAFCEHNDILALPDHRNAVLDDLVEYILSEPIDELSLAGFRIQAADELSERWPAAAWSGYESEAPFIELDTIRQEDVEYLSRLSRNSRSQIRRSLRLYTERHGTPFTDTPDSTSEALDWFSELVDMHQQHWTGKGETGAFSDDAVRFHRRLIEQTFAAGNKDMQASLVRAGFGSTTIGMLYYLEHGRCANFYQSGLRYDEDERLKPGLVAHTLSVQHYIDKGFAEYDFLGGDPVTPRYKQSMSTNRRTLAWRELPAPTLRVNLLGRIRALKQRIQKR